MKEGYKFVNPIEMCKVKKIINNENERKFT